MKGKRLFFYAIGVSWFLSGGLGGDFINDSGSQGASRVWAEESPRSAAARAVDFFNDWSAARSAQPSLNNPHPDWSIAEGAHLSRRTPSEEMFSVEESGEGDKEPEREESIWEQIEWGLVVGGTLHGNATSDEERWASQTDAFFSADLACLIPLSEKTSFYGLIEGGDGAGIDGRIATFAGFNDEADPDERLRMTEAWFEHTFENDWRLRVGKVDLMTEFDQNEFANCGFEQFNSSGFVNNLAIDVPDNTFGGFLWRNFNEVFSLGAGYQGTNGWDNVFSHGFGILESDLHTHFFGRAGTIRFYGWVNDSDLYEKTNSGWGTSWNQHLTERVGIWARAGFQDKEASDFDSHISGGVEFHQFHPIRTKDIIGIAWGIASPTELYAEASEFSTANERFLESYYRWQVNDFSHLAPYLQWVQNPAGEAEASDVLVLGLRGVIAL